MNKTLCCVSLIITLFACKKENKDIITKFPTVFIYTDLEIKAIEVFDKNGPVTEYDSVLDDFEYSSLWLNDSIKLIDPSIAVKYKSYNVQTVHAIEYDTCDLYIADDEFLLISQNLPQGIIILDTKEPDNFRISYNESEIKDGIREIYKKKEDIWLNERRAIKIFSKTIQFGSENYEMVGQYNARNYSIQELCENLDENEFISVVSYSLKFSMQ